MIEQFLRVKPLAVLFLSLFLFRTALSQIPGDEPGELHALFSEDWQWMLGNYPEAASFLGDHSNDDRLIDLSLGAHKKRQMHEREMLKRIRSIKKEELEGQDVISYELFLLNKELEVESQKFSLGQIPISVSSGGQFFPVTQLWGPQLDIPDLINFMPFNTVRDYENYLKRLAAVPAYLDQAMRILEEHRKTGWLPPSVPLRSVAAQIAALVVNDPEASVLYKPFASIPKDIPAQEVGRISAEAKSVLHTSVAPAFRKFGEYWNGTYYPACRTEIAGTRLPKGKEFYEFLIRRETTTNLSAREIHDIGLREVARIRREMGSVIQQTGFNGTFKEFLAFLRTDPRFYFTRAEDLVTAYRDICKRADAVLPALFVELPRNQYGVRETPSFAAPSSTTGFYTPGAPDGSRPGWYLVNTYKLETRPKYEMEALSMHEAVPGHHLQISRAQELKGLPDFRRNAGYTAYVEGWGLYAESLGSEMGFYADPYSKFGQLTYEMWRACRLVVDTGIHQFGWTRQQAIDYILENTAKTEQDVIVEIDRYIVWPGQALAYKLGELKIKELREKAQHILGEKFDIRRFHNAVLDDGPLPLSLLETRINQWITQQH
jgi:uncharacterized protein (DUF885 family)